MEQTTEFELAQPPADGISSVQFCPSAENSLLVSSWDTSLRMYDVESNVMRCKFNGASPVLDCAWGENSGQAFSVGLDQAVKSYNLEAGTTTTLGTHEAGVRCVEFSGSHGLVASGSWDKTVKLWDPRTNQAVGSYTQPDKVYTMSATSTGKLIVGTAGRHVWIWDLRNMDAVEQRRESNLKYQTRCIKASPNGEAYILTSIEGRVALEYVDPSPAAQDKKFAFKCHRLKVDGQDTIFPVNTVDFHPVYHTFATGGCDGIVNVWDGNNRKRICQFHRYPSSIASCSFNSTGTLLAIASSYTYEEGEKDHPTDAIFIRRTADVEVMPK